MPYVLDSDMAKYGYRQRSQNDEDGIIEEIFRRLGIENGTFCEIGVENGLECNSLYLLHKGWRGVWVDGGAERAVRERVPEPADVGGGEERPLPRGQPVGDEMEHLVAVAAAEPVGFGHRHVPRRRGSRLPPFTIQAG